MPIEEAEMDFRYTYPGTGRRSKGPVLKVVLAHFFYFLYSLVSYFKDFIFNLKAFSLLFRGSLFMKWRTDPLSSILHYTH